MFSEAWRTLQGHPQGSMYTHPGHWYFQLEAPFFHCIGTILEIALLTFPLPCKNLPHFSNCWGVWEWLPYRLIKKDVKFLLDNICWQKAALPCMQSLHNSSAFQGQGAWIGCSTIFWYLVLCAQSHMHNFMWKLEQQTLAYQCPHLVKPWGRSHCLHFHLVLIWVPLWHGKANAFAALQIRKNVPEMGWDNTWK